MRTLAYVAACVAVPAAWGALMYVVFGRIHGRRKAPPPIDYMI